MYGWDPDVRKTVGLEVELKLDQQSSCDETNQADWWSSWLFAGAKAGPRSAVVEEGKLSAIVFVSFHRTQLVKQAVGEQHLESQRLAKGTTV